MKNILVIGNSIVYSNVCSELVDGDLGYQLTPYRNDGSKRTTDWGEEAIKEHLEAHENEYDAVIVDLLESQGAKACKDASYKGLIVGLISFEEDSIEEADINVVISIRKIGNLRKTLDSHFK